MTFQEAARGTLMAASERVGQTVTISAVSYPCVRTEVSAERLLLGEGDLDAYDFSLRLPYSDGMTEALLPTIGDTVTYSGTTYRVLARGFDGVGAGAQLHLGSEEQGLRL